MVTGVLSLKAFPSGEVSPCPRHPWAPGHGGWRSSCSSLAWGGGGQPSTAGSHRAPPPPGHPPSRGLQLLPTLLRDEGPWALLPQRSLSRPCLSVCACFHPRSLSAWEEQGFREQQGQGLRNVWAGAPGTKPDVEGPGVRRAAHLSGLRFWVGARLTTKVTPGSGSSWGCGGESRVLFI